MLLCPYIQTLLILLALPSLSLSGFITQVDKGLVRFVESPDDDVIVRLGHQFVLNCSAIDAQGLSLDVHWLKDGIPMDENVHRHSLAIANVTELDEGVYSCKVNIANGDIVTGGAKVTLARPPEFITQPSDIKVHVGSPVSLECAAHAMEHMEFTWNKNGTPIDTTSSGFEYVVVPSGSLQIHAAVLEDAGAYVCTVTSAIGSEVSSVGVLTVLQADLTGHVIVDHVINVVTPQDQQVAKGDTAFFQCLFHSSDNVQFDWRRIQGIMPSDRATYEGTNLKIRDVQPWDAGAYACITKHKLSGKTTEWKAELTVLGPPLLIEAPKDVTVRRGSTARFKCYTQGTPVPEIEWYKNGEPVNIGGRVKVFPEAHKSPGLVDRPDITYQRDLVISSVQPGDVGIYQCIVTNSAGQISAAASLIFNGKVSVTDGPRDLVVRTSQSDKTMKISWKPPDHMPVYVYIIHFYKTNNGRENTHSAMDTCEDGVCRSDCCPAEELQPHTNYTFYVSGVTLTGEFSAPSESVVAVTWDDYAANVASLTVTGLDETSVSLEWTPPPPKQLPGTVVQYMLQYAASGRETKTMHFPPHVTKYILLGLHSGLTYKFRVLVQTEAGYPPNAVLASGMRYPWIQYKMGKAGVAEPLVAPIILTSAVNSTAITVQWTPMGDVVPSGYLITYQLLSSPTSHSQTQRIRAHRESRAKIIAGLSASSLYEVSVAAVSDAGESGSRSSKAVQTLATPTPEPGPEPPVAVVVEPPMDIQCQPVQPGRVVLRWLPPPSKRVIVGYTVRYHLVFEEHHPKPDIVPAQEVVYVEKPAYEAVMLVPGRTYSFAVRSHDRYGYVGPYSHEFACVSPSNGGAPGAPKDVHLQFINQSSLLVQWKPPSNFSLVLSYLIEYCVDHPSTAIWNKMVVNGTRTNTVLNDLESASVYFVRVSARSVDGVGPWTHIFSCSYEGGQPSGVVGGLIGVVAVLLCVLLVVVCCCKSRRHVHVCCHLNCTHRDHSKPNGHVPNGQVTQAPLCEVQELQTLLPPLMENMECDAKGGEEGVRPRCIKVVSVPNINPTTSAMRSHQELPVVVHVEESSGESTHSWSLHEDHSSSSSQCRHTCSLPNLADSGIGFDDCHANTRRQALSVSPPHSVSGRCHSPVTRCVTAHSANEVVRLVA